MKTFVIGDIHGTYKALLQCLELSRFDRDKDRLICLGDVCDRGKQVRECIDELLTLPGCIYILGNHDAWSLEWAINGKMPQEWLDQGGAQTMMSYKETGMPGEHIRFLAEAHFYFVDQNRLFVHGGFDPQRTVEETPKEIFLWDRSLLKKAQQFQMASADYKFGNYDEIFVGHTPTLNFGKEGPQKFCNVWGLDTGAGWGARLTIMDVDTKEFWQSNRVN
ncbi:MAG: metallophosphoesterase [Candidatus Omnitrophica bacterium]|nr:metallophosphoesterase [Candidatus Omnitrophota bacterium]